MAVVFYVDPKLANDSEEDTVSNITLSYTFFPVRLPARPVAESANSEKPGRISKVQRTKDGANTKAGRASWRIQRWRMRMPSRTTITIW
jgi:hypothetical protein